MKRDLKKQIRETVIEHLRSLNLRDYFPRVSPEEIDAEMYEIKLLLLGKKRGQRNAAGFGNSKAVKPGDASAFAAAILDEKKWDNFSPG